MTRDGNLFADLPLTVLAHEEISDLLTSRDLRIERIVSTGHASPVDYWYDQEWHEWVILLRGSAQLLFEDETDVRFLSPGDFVHIAAHRRHRVLSTDPQEVTVWLAVHYR
jgi:cupin 2 domain-containing protein